MPERKTVFLLSLLLLAVLGVYSGHFHNQFHFDDIPTVVSNPYIRDIHNIARFFTDARTFSVLPRNRTYRPVVSTSLAIDYWLGGGLQPLWFHVSTFCWFLIQLTLMYALFRKICDLALPDRRNGIVALAATALYALHPAMAETVNYVIQRGDLYSTLGVIAGIVVYACAPRWRRFGLYLAPVAGALLSKPPALIFPALLFLYIWLFEEDARNDRLLWTLSRCAPALAVVACFGYLTVFMTPKEFHVGVPSAYAYRITQPLVALRYFQTFFMPGGLTADTDHVPIASVWKDWAWVGFVFVGVLLATAVIFSKNRAWRPVAFGIWWFLLAMVPTSIYPLSEVENDHRMFFPFVGLVIAVVWPVALWIYRQAPRRIFIRGLAAVFCIELMVLSLGTMQRNQVWRTEESLWRDVTIKSPRNARGLVGYGGTFLQRGDPAEALVYFKKAEPFAARYPTLEANLGVAYGALKQNAEAERHFLRCLELDPSYEAGRYVYAHWLEDNGRRPEAIEQLRLSVKWNPDFLSSLYLLMEIFAKKESWPTVKGLAEFLLQRFPADQDAKTFRLMALRQIDGDLEQTSETPEALLNLSALYYQIGRYEDAVAAAREVLALRPEYPEAYNNLAASLNSLQRWDEAAEASRKALQLRPQFGSARKNLARAEDGKEKSVAR